MSSFSQRKAGSPSKSYNISIVGLGHRGYETHFCATLGSEDIRVIAICDSQEDVRIRFQGKHPNVPAYSDLDDLLHHHTPDFAVVAVPHKVHLEIITKLANANVPVLKEKPASTSVRELQDLKNLTLKLGVAYQKRFERRYILFQACLPLVGQVVSFRATMIKNILNLQSTWRASDNVGVTEDMGSHMIDVLVNFFGQPASVTSRYTYSVRRQQAYGGEDISDTALYWGGHRPFSGHLYVSRVGHKAEESLVVTGTEGSLCLDHDEVQLVRADGSVVLCTNHHNTKQDAILMMLRQFGCYVSSSSPAFHFSASLSNCTDTVVLTDRIRRSAWDNLDILSAANVEPEVASLQGQHFVWPIIDEKMVSSVVKQMRTSLSIYDRSGVYETFENRWCDLHELRHALVCSSGTAAIHSMFEALQLMPGDEILTPVYTFFATATPMLQCGAVPVFCDSLSNGNIDPAEITRRATSKTKALIVTHMWGLPCDMPRIVQICQSLNIFVLEDCSHAHGAAIAGKRVGTWGDAAVWSLQAQKNITGGQAGVLGTNSDDLYARAVIFGHFNKRAKQEVLEHHPMRKFWLTGTGLNFRAHPLAIAMANSQLDCMPDWMKHREQYARMLLTGLSGIPFLCLPHVDRDVRHAWYAFVMTFDKRRAPVGLTREVFVDELKHRGLQAVDIPKSTCLLNELPLFTHTHEAFPRFGDQPWHAPQIGFEVAQGFYDSAIKLPVWATEKDADVVKFYAATIAHVARVFLTKGDNVHTQAKL